MKPQALLLAASLLLSKFNVYREWKKQNKNSNRRVKFSFLLEGEK